MTPNEKTIVVTGAGGGIGRALVSRFMADKAKTVVAVDINPDSVGETARQFGCIAMSADLSKDEEVRRIIEDTETACGPIGLFCSNASVALGESEQSPDQEWQLSWDINVMPHVYAARHLVPRMIALGGGYFLNTASAAGLLNQVGSAAYGVSKHAAVGFGEWLALTYAHQGIKVSLLCPQAVRTPMIEATLETSGAAAAAGDGIMEPEEVADIVVAGLKRENFLILPHPEVEHYMRGKSADYDRWIAGMNKLHQRLNG